MPIGVIGERGDLTYDYEHLGAGAETLPRNWATARANFPPC